MDSQRANVVLDRKLVSKAGDWKVLDGEFTARAAATNAWIEIVSEAAGPLWIGAVSLLPADNFHGMRRDVVKLFQSLKPGCLRWPGGCFAEYYPWQDGLLPVDQRPPIGPHQWGGLLPDTDGYDNHEIGTDEFIALCRELDCAPVFTTRYGGGGSPEEAAAWVEYCNGGKETRWGKVRAERGHPEPYRVKYWYVGNEIWGMSLVKNKDPKACAALSRQFAEGMKKVDSSIQLIGCAPTHEEGLLQPWVAPLLAEAGDSLAMVQNGWYFPDPNKVNMADSVKAPTQGVLSLLKSLRQFTDRTPGGKHLGIAYYEWNTYWGRSGDVVGGVFAAGVLNMMCREAEPLGLVLAGYFQPVTEGAIKVEPLTCELDPDGEVFALYAQHQGNRLLKTPAMPADADLDLCASLTPDGRSVYVTALNRSMSSECTLELSVRNFAGPATAAAKLLVPRTLEVKGRFANRSEMLEFVGGRKVALKIPPCGIARVRLGSPGPLE
jgi:alpha-L-arabinofuranosidase